MVRSKVERHEIENRKTIKKTNKTKVGSLKNKLRPRRPRRLGDSLPSSRIPGARSWCWSHPSPSGPRYNSAPVQPLHPVHHHDQPGDTLQLPSAHPRRWKHAWIPGPKLGVAEETVNTSSSPGAPNENVKTEKKTDKLTHLD